MKSFLLLFIFLSSLLVVSCKNQETALNSQKEPKSVPTDTLSSDYYKVRVLQDETANLNAETDRFQLVKMEEKNGWLLLEVNYSGGCRDHEFTLIHQGAYKESMPPQLDVLLAHNSNEDHCRAFITQKLAIPLKELKYSENDGELILNFRQLNISRKVSY